MSETAAASHALVGRRWPIARYRFTVAAEQGLPLPDHAGSLLRGAFGAALRRAACMTGLPACQPCPLYRSCPYPAIFETPPRPTPLAQAFAQVPNPYVIEPPPLGTRRVGAGEPWHFHLVLAGDDAGRHLPLIVHAWQRALRHGLGRERIPAALLAVEQCDGTGRPAEPVFDRESSQVLPHDASLDMPPAPIALQRLDLHVHTPLRLQHHGQPLGPAALDVRTLALAALRRATLMLHLHGGSAPEADVAALLEAAAQVRDDRRGLRWHDWTRYSSRQQQEMTLGGVLGVWRLEGPLEPIWPWLWLAQWLHLGKNATMGLGRVSLVHSARDTLREAPNCPQGPAQGVDAPGFSGGVR
jgi:hypothetical protein